MLKEIVIWPSEDDKGYDRGKFFEDLTNRIFTSQRFKVDSNVHVTGQEFDLECAHIDRINERCLVECKAKKSLSSDEIKKFVFSAEFKQFNYGFFLYTGRFERQVSGLIKEIQSDSRYNNLYFWNADKVIELLITSTTIKEFEYEFDGYEIRKVILLYSHIGCFYIPILSSTTVPTHFCVIDAQSNTQIFDENIITSIKDYIDELASLNYLSLENEEGNKTTIITELETVAEIQSSDSWDDYKPASLRHFVGRKRQKDRLFDFLKDVRKTSINKRVFYVDGKSGWGKSSLMNDLRERCRNRHYKNKYLALVVDSRSANSHNFLPLTYKMLIEKAVNESFIPKKFLKIKIPSSFDVLGDDLTVELLQWLEEKKKLLIIVFDQFEDVFKKENIFKSFYKFLVDVNNKQNNILLGFSWKSEVNIPIENESYHLWQQSKDYAYQITLDEFNTSESKAIIKQLEKDISEKLNIDFIRKIIDNSQGYPWLVKKLCIHIKKQYSQNIDIESLYDQDFQVESLFKGDLEDLASQEVSILRYIANRAYNEQSLDVTELDDVVDSSIVQQLIHKRYVIKSGTKYNIYWDIFRDYLVLDEIPPIGETYLIRQPVNSVFEAYNAFSISRVLTLEDFLSHVSSSVAEGAALNLLRELRSLGVVNYKNNRYHLKSDEHDVDITFFRKFLFEKLNKHSFTLELKKLEVKEITIEDLKHIIRNKIKTKKYAEKTLGTYAQTFLGWLDFANIEIPNMSAATLRKAKNALSFTPQMYPKDVEEFVLKFESRDFNNKTKRDDKLIYDSKSLGLIQSNKNVLCLTDRGRNAVQGSEIQRKRILSECAIQTDKIKYAYDKYCDNTEINSRNFKPLITSVLEGLNSEVYINKTSRTLFLWASYIYECETQSNKKIQRTQKDAPLI